MPNYSFVCEICQKKFQKNLCMGSKEKVTCDCGGEGLKVFGIPSCKFSNPNESSKWEDFSYRAGVNYEKAQKERRLATEEWYAKSGGKNLPHVNIDDSSVGEEISDVHEIPGIKKTSV